MNEDELAIERLQRNWGLWRDTRRWEELRGTFAPNARIKTTWFDGAAADFVAASIRSAEKPVLVLHSIGASTVSIQGRRALAETRVTLLLRDRLEGAEVDVVCHGRFIDRLVKQDDERWAILERLPIYEKDSLTPTRPGTPLQLDEAALARFPVGYRHLAYLQSRAGATIVMDIPAHNSEEQRQLYAMAEAWLAAPEPAR